jgi:hypothetical protein
MTPKAHILAILLLSLTSTSILAQNPGAVGEDPAHAELREFRDRFLEALNSGNVETSIPLLHPNCVITWHNAEVSRGHKGVRDYHNKIMNGPERLVESFHCAINVDEFTILHGGDTGICFGSTKEHFKLTNGKELKVDGRFSATLVKEGGNWQLANLHASTNLFRLAKQSLFTLATIVGIGGLIIGVLIGRWRR